MHEVGYNMSLHFPPAAIILKLENEMQVKLDIMLHNL